MQDIDPMNFKDMAKLKNVNDDLFHSSRLHQDGERYISLTDAIKVLEKYTK